MLLWFHGCDKYFHKVLSIERNFNQINHYLRNCMKNQFLFDYPEGPGAFPAVMIVPGLRYPMDGPIFKQMTRIVVDMGFVVVRLNLVFYLNDPVNGMPSDDLEVELNELQALDLQLRMDKKVDPSRIVILGKSFGSVVAWKVFRSRKDYLAGILMTPLCAEEGDSHYPISSEEVRPVLLIAGDNDPYCKLNLVRRLLGVLGARTELQIVPGNHRLEKADVPTAQKDLVSVEAVWEFRRNITDLTMNICAWIKASSDRNELRES